jgi:gluconate kinase
VPTRGGGVPGERVEAARVVLIVGVPGAGKTTVALALAKKFERSACIEGDYVQHGLTVAGLVAPNEAPADESHRQLELRWRNCAMLADNFFRVGFTAVIEHAASDRYWLDLFQGAVRARPLSIIVLAPDAAVAVERDRDRSEKQVAHLFAHMDADMRRNLPDVGWWLDTSALTVEQTVAAILDRGLFLGEV